MVLKASKQELKSRDPAAWRAYLLGVWRRHQDETAVAALYESKIRIAERLLTEWVAAHPEMKLPVAFDSWYTTPGFCHYLDGELKLPYVGTLAEDTLVRRQSGEEKVGDFAQRLKAEHQQALAAGKARVFRPIRITYKGEQEQYYSYCATHRVNNFGKGPPRD